jgi:FkbM family methyltransferase
MVRGLLGLVWQALLARSCLACGRLVRIDGIGDLIYQGQIHDERRVYQLDSQIVGDAKYLYFVASYQQWAISRIVGGTDVVLFSTEGSTPESNHWFSFEDDTWKPKHGMVSVCAGDSKIAPANRFQIELPPEIRSVIINIGSNLDPVMPPQGEDAAFVATIAFEPIPTTVAQIIPHPNLFVVNAAIAGHDGLTTVSTYNDNGVSSSMFKPAAASGWNNQTRRGDGKQYVVPVLSFATVLQSIASHINIAFLKTDAQGADFAAVKSLDAAAMMRVPILVIECATQNIYTYADTNNDFCRDWLPHMTAFGYRVQGLDCGEVAEWESIDRGLVEIPTMEREWKSGPAGFTLERYCEIEKRRHPTRKPGRAECNVLWVHTGTRLTAASRPPVAEGEWGLDPGHWVPARRT